MKPLRTICGRQVFHVLLLVLSLLWSCRETAPPRFILVFVDFSGTAQYSRDYYKEVVQKMVMKLDRGGDKIVVNQISDKTWSDAKPLLQSEPFPKPAPLENPLVYKKKKEEFQARLQTELKATCDAIDKGSISPYTDIINAFMVAANIFSRKTQCILVLLSDMLQDSIIAGTRWNFERDRIDSAYCSTLISTLKKYQLIPNLDGVVVYVGGAKSAEQDATDERAIEVRRFWELYIKETGADLKEYGQYLHHLLSE